jgi:hypothetical protein
MTTVTVTKSQGYQLAMASVTGLSSLKLDPESGKARIAFSTSATPPSVAAGDEAGFSLVGGQGWCRWIPRCDGRLVDHTRRPSGCRHLGRLQRAAVASAAAALGAAADALWPAVPAGVADMASRY